MAAQLKRHLKKKIDSGADALPDELVFLNNVNYFAVAQQRVQYVREWYVEIKAASLKPLLDVKTKLNAARSINRRQTVEILKLQNDMVSLEFKLEEMVRVNARQAESIKDQRMIEVEVEEAQKALRECQKEKQDLTAELAALDLANEQLLANMGEDNRFRHPKSDKNFFTEMQERGQLPAGPAIQGGSGGSNKR